MANRPPIIVVLGSVDHGKTTLLDYIRKTNVAAREAGAITQSIGAYEIEHNDKKITFIDTPGHEAFTTMRARGAAVADIAILIVAADDSVKAQTKEAIKIIKESETPFVVAINKIDKNNADVQKTKNDLAKEGVLLEGYGGTVSYQELSAKTGEGVGALLDHLLLEADLEKRPVDLSKPAEGFILEAKLDRRRGVVASAIVKNGTLRAGDPIAAGAAEGKVRGLENFLKKNIKEAVPSMPVVILGFSAMPKAGDLFMVGADATKEAVVEKKRGIIDENALKLILRADVEGSLDALAQIVQNLPLKGGQSIHIVDQAVGDISDGDVKLAVSTGSMIIGFNVKTDKGAENLARAQGVTMLTSNIIYDLTKALEEKLHAGELISGKLEILATFGKKGTKQVIGGKVTEGEIKNHAELGVERRGEVIGVGRVVNLQRQKADVQTVAAGNECGLLFNSEVEIRAGDILLAK